MFFILKNILYNYDMFLGKALVDVLVLGSDVQSAATKDLLPLLGALKHMACWYAARITVVAQHSSV